MSNIDYYLLEDHGARQRTILVGAGVGLVLGTVAQAFGLSINVTAGICFAAAGVVEITRAVRYKQPRRKGKVAVAAIPVRRQLIYTAFSAAAVLVLALLRLPRALARAIDRELTTAAGTPTSSRSIKTAQTMLAGADAENLKLDPRVVKEVGNRFADAAPEATVAWDVALEAANYYSSQLTPGSVPVLGKLRRAANASLYYASLRENVDVWEVGDASPENSALIQPLDEPNPFEHESGAQFIILEMHRKENFHLEPVHFKHFIFTNVTVRYGGGKVWLEDVYFVNCTFAFDRSLAASALVKEITSSASVNFKSL